MENLNAEQIRYKMREDQIKTALVCLSKPNSAPADREKCYFMWKEPSCFSCYHEVAQNALALIKSQELRIKELTCENMELKSQQQEVLTEEEADWLDEQAKIVNETIIQIKADTVRKVAERLTSFFSDDDMLRFTEVDAEYINGQIMKITEYMLRGDGI